MAITVLSNNPKVKWPLIVRDLAARFQRPEEALLNVVDVTSPAADMRDIFMVHPNFLLVGRAAQEYFVRRLPHGYRMKELDYGQSVPTFYIIDAISGFSKFFSALYFPEPECLSGRNLFSGCVFLLENQSLRDRLFVHQIRRHFAPHEPAIFGVAPGTLPQATVAGRNELVRTFARQCNHGVVELQKTQTADIPF